ncbi:VIT1/CCC1 transporter family protein, partial [Schaalia hyovaginalis]|uniref:VIT1/CCC1 transporter family protein n=1 Tax=Schaalia hyovaginalis TaxID=29316 RepID=UPI0038B3776C
PATFVGVLIALALTGYVSAARGAAPRGRAVLRLLVGGAAAMALTFVVGRAFGVDV